MYEEVVVRKSGNLFNFYIAKLTKLCIFPIPQLASLRPAVAKGYGGHGRDERKNVCVA